MCFGVKGRIEYAVRNAVLILKAKYRNNVFNKTYFTLCLSYFFSSTFHVLHIFVSISENKGNIIITCNLVELGIIYTN